MPKLIHAAIASLDGYVEDEQGGFAWARPDEEVHAFVNELERPIGTYLYGRRMYETMSAWETMPTSADQPAAVREFAAIWRAADKVVYSATLANRPAGTASVTGPPLSRPRGCRVAGQGRARPRGAPHG
jgi:dihydrofolate reductase